MLGDLGDLGPEPLIDMVGFVLLPSTRKQLLQVLCRLHIGETRPLSMLQQQGKSRVLILEKQELR